MDEQKEKEFWSSAAKMLRTLAPKTRVLAIAAMLERHVKSNPLECTEEELAAATLTLSRSMMTKMTTAQTAVVQSLVASREALKEGVDPALQRAIKQTFDP